MTRKLEGDRISRALKIALALVTHDLIKAPVTKAVYKNLRVLFIERMHFDYDFDFGTFINRWVISSDRCSRLQPVPRLFALAHCPGSVQLM